MARYAFDNAAAEAASRFNALESCYDPVTRVRLAETGVGPGWRCLEVGAGAGSIGLWLSDAVGSSGHVTVTDLAPERIKPQLAARTNTSVLRHDIVADAMPAGVFDLIHSRLVLLHLPERAQVLGRLVDALAPGGWLLLEDPGFAVQSYPMVSARGRRGAGDAKRGRSDAE